MKFSYQIIPLALIFILSACGGGGGGGGGNNGGSSGGGSTGGGSTGGGSSLDTVSESGTLAWIGENDTQLIFPATLSGATLYRSSETGCDIVNITSCADGQFDTLDSNIVTDTSLSLSQSTAFYQLHNGASLEPERIVSAKTYPQGGDNVTTFFNGRLWMVNGGIIDLAGEHASVWSSVDGIDWIEEVSEAPFPLREGHQLVSFNNQLWLIGGDNDTAYKGTVGEIWYSSDGINWTKNSAGASAGLRSHHQAVVFDNKLWLIGGRSRNTRKNDVWVSTDGLVWTEVTQTNAFPAREDHQAFVFDGELWIVGGTSGGINVFNDVWHSSDGADWSEVATTLTKFSGRIGHATIVDNGKIWLLGGKGGVDDDYQILHDTWSSADGIDWLKETSSGQLPSRKDHQLTRFNNRIWLSGGESNTNDGVTGDVWSSADGLAWQAEPNGGMFSPRSHMQTVEFNGRMWLIGGTTVGYATTNDVYSSNDGVNWRLEIEHAAFPARQGHQVIVYQDKLWLIAGEAWSSDGVAAPQHEMFNDVWSSDDGINWVEATDDAAFLARSQHQAVVFNDAMWVIGGWEGNQSNYDGRNDVWKSTDGITWVEIAPQDTSATPANFSTRRAFELLVFKNKLWLFFGTGETSITDTWSTTDGSNWVEESDSIPFVLRHHHQIAIFNDELWMVGGIGENTGLSYNDYYSNEVWSSSDGINWVNKIPNFGAPFRTDIGHQLLTYKGNLWRIGGYGAIKRHDNSGINSNAVWRSEDGEIWRRGKQINMH